MKLRILVTGANGMLGQDLCPILEEAGHEVIRTDTGAPPAHNRALWELLDVTDVQNVRHTLLRHQPDVVIHAAAYTDVDGCERNPDHAFRVNALGTWNVAALCGAHHMTLCYLSTDFVFDGARSTPYTEFDPPNPINRYGASKLAGERFVAQLCRQHFIVRTAWLFGVHGGKSFPDRMLQLARTHRERFVVADQFGSPTYTRDLSHALVELLTSPLYGTYHIVNAGQCSWFELARKTLELAGVTTMEVKPIPASEYPGPTRRPAYSVLRRYALELQGRDFLRPWQQALAEFIRQRQSIETGGSASGAGSENA
ncbi:MAG: dTDP-4-dehydrorhamnose reductase [Chloroherpetonaceae bacterium]|nr:dTDP-4-dehydrorhamnose reductase [Chthonomonadaceae bacterium]MDW8208048.1 dTDP-4-dehydrorhamnose reductase [Chloroherpetonaceae bacterium]